MAQNHVEKIVGFLRRLAEDGSLAERLVESGFRAVTADAIKMWVRESVKLLPEDVKALYFENPLIAPHTRRALASNWALVEKYLGNPQNTLQKMASVSPENRVALQDPATKSYIMKEIEETYSYLVSFMAQWPTSPKETSGKVHYGAETP